MDVSNLADTTASGDSWYAQLGNLVKTGTDAYGAITGANKPAATPAPAAKSTGFFTQKNLIIIGAIASVVAVAFFLFKRK